MYWLFKRSISCRTYYKTSFIWILHSSTLRWLNAIVVKFVAYFGSKKLHFLKMGQELATDYVSDLLRARSYVPSIEDTRKNAKQSRLSSIDYNNRLD